MEDVKDHVLLIVSFCNNPYLIYETNKNDQLIHV